MAPVICRKHLGASFYDFDIWFWNYCDSVVLFSFSFYLYNWSFL